MGPKVVGGIGFVLICANDAPTHETIARRMIAATFAARSISVPPLVILRG